MTPARLLDHITAARWFGGKGRSAQLVAVSPLPWLRSPGNWPACRCEIAELRYADGTTERYQLLISYRPTPGDDPLVIVDDPDHGRLYGADGSADPDFHAALLQLLVGPEPSIGPELPGRPRVVVRRPGVPAGSAIPTIDAVGFDGPTRVFGGEQSNTSILYGDTGWLKIFRRLEAGVNPDVDIHDRLCSAGNNRIARLYGWLQAEGIVHDDHPTDLAMLVEQLPEAIDGWQLAVAAVQENRSFSDQAESLGAALAAVHADLRQHFPTGTVAGEAAADLMIGRLQAAATVVPELAPQVPALTALFDRLRGRSIPVQRLHADFHLGQALDNTSGWKIIDFEGEPAKPFSDRTRPDSIWRDLAGALRSFDYAAAYGGIKRTDRWRTACQQAFLSGYGATTTREPDLAAAYLADKAIYEIVYEARNRPDWVTIPLSAVGELTGYRAGENAQ